MKKKILPALLALIILYCLFFPLKTAQSVSAGLALWYRAILPTLLPFCIFSSIIIRSGVYDNFFDKLAPVFQRIYPVRSPLIYPLIAGFLFGFPLGSKICADLYTSGKITSKEAELVSCISNNFGPAFLYNYVIAALFSNSIPAAMVYCACYLPPILLGRILLSRSAFQANVSQTQTYKKPASGSHINMKTIDAGILDGFTTMIKLAGYIILSALLADIIQSVPFQNEILKCVCIGSIEVTTGIHYIKSMDCSMLISALLSIGLVNFGGFSGLCQTNAMMKSAGIRMKNYICFKLLCSLTGMTVILICFTIR